ncbi:MAG: lysophospholipid acyltransferase family protein [Desulfobacterales bacterium]|nr:lysophospholipid acyltransferase family protein [Desulfobacterales bacterium]
MFKKLKFIIYTRPFIFFAYYLIQIYSMTLRIKVENEEHWQKLREQGTSVLLCAWHQQFFSAIRHFKTYSKYNPGLMISQSKDGDLISGVANRVGWHTPRGSSSRGGKQAMDMMITHLKKYGLGAHILDGPTGPIGKVKAGAIKMALAADAVVIPLYTSAEHAWFFNSWDRFMLPKPFSRVFITFGREIRFKASENEDNFEGHRQYLENTMRPGLFL